MAGLILVGLICFGSFVLSFVVLLKNYKSNLNLLFFIFAQLNSIWAFVNLMTGLTSYDGWVNGMYGSGALVMSTGVIWCSYLIEQKVNWLKYIIFLTFSLIFSVLSLFTNLIIERIDQMHFGYFEGEFGVLFPLYAGFMFFCCVFLIYKLFSSFLKSRGTKRLQILYVLLGAGIFSFLAMFLSFILPFLKINFFSQYDLLGSFIFLLLIAYSIVRYRLMDIRLIISKSLLYFALVTSLASLFAFFTFLTSRVISEESSFGKIILSIVSSLIVIVGLDPLKRFLNRITDNFFYRDKVDYQRVLQLVGEKMSKELDLEKLILEVSQTVARELKINFVYILHHAQNGVFESVNLPGVNISLIKNGPIINYLEKTRQIVVTEEIIRLKSEPKMKNRLEELEILEERLISQKIELAVPIVNEDQIRAILVAGRKLSDAVYGQEDIDFMEIFGPQMANALEKSRLFEEVQKSKENLEILIDQRTHDLKERNQYLLAMQNLANFITRSLDFKNVMQTIVDGIRYELGFVGGMISFINEADSTINPSFFTQAPIIKKVMSSLPQDPFQYKVHLSQTDNTAIQAIIKQEVVLTSSFYSSIKPSLPETLSIQMQDRLGVKSVATAPIFSEEKVKGVVHFFLVDATSEVTDLDKEMMKSLADQIGIVYRNLLLYQEIQRTNQDLKSANERLQNLDKAKSEFLSIASHQLRTPLTGIKGYLSMILDGDFGQLPEAFRKVITDVFLNTDRLTRLVNVFLNVSRIESGRFVLDKHPYDTVKLIQSAVDELIVTAEAKNLKLIFKTPGIIIPQVDLDHDKIKDVALNLIDNAIKYTPKGSVEIHLEKTDQEVVVKVKDTGIGIDPEEARGLFRKFVRGDGIAQINTGGSGLGLYIAKKIIEAHGGRIWVESKGEGSGSTFIFTLPINL